MILELEGVQVLTRNELKCSKGKEGELLFCPCPDGTCIISEGKSCEVLIPLLCVFEKTHSLFEGFV